MAKDYVGVAWEEIRIHVEDDIRIGAFEDMAAQKQYQNPLKRGDTVRIVGDVCQGLVGELKVIDPEQEDECFFGVALHAIEGWIFFSADEIERVENIDMAELPF